MSYVPNYQDYEPPSHEDRQTIIVLPLERNQRPVGYVWPKPKKHKAKKKLK